METSTALIREIRPEDNAEVATVIRKVLVETVKASGRDTTVCVSAGRTGNFRL